MYEEEEERNASFCFSLLLGVFLSGLIFYLLY